MTAEPYRLSFTTGGLLRVEAVAIAEIIETTDDKSTVRSIAMSSNAVQQRTEASTLRVTREVIGRLDELPSDAVGLIARGSVEDSRHLLWLAICLRYRFLRDFGREVLRDRLVSGRGRLDHDDFDTFWNLQSSWIDALRDTAESTRNKLRQNTFRILREAELLTDDGAVQAVQLSPDVARIIADRNPELALSFPVYDAQITAMTGAEER